jgi:putative DNA primase/helicase
MPDVETSCVLSEALGYASRGWPVLPLHAVRDGRCSCGNSDCSSPGKHPIGAAAPNGVSNSTTDRAIIEEWWRQYPDANVGIATGAVSGIVVIDVDGDDGEKSAKEFGVPPTVTAITGGGRHLIFATPETPIHNAVRFRPGLDARGDGGYIVAPPSLHASGVRYRWDSENGLGIDDLDPVPLPQPYVDVLKNGRPHGEVVTLRDDWVALLTQPILDGTRNDNVFSIAYGLLCEGLSSDSAAAIVLALNGHLCRPPLTETEVRSVVASAMKRKLDRQKQTPTTQTPAKLALRNIEPWPEPVNGADVLDDLVTAISRYVVLPLDAAIATALWVVYSHIHTAAFISPRLAVLSATKRCAKTRLLEVIQYVVPRPLFQSNASTAAVFRVIDGMSPTMLLDEADTWIEKDPELRGILNAGHSFSGAVVYRCEGDKNEPRAFKVFTPIAFAMIGRPPDTLEDRSIVIQMRRRRPEERVERIRHDRMMVEMDPLARRLARWAADTRDEIASSDPDVPDELDDRAADNWRPLLAVADAGGSWWPHKAREAASSTLARREEQDHAVALLDDLRTVFGQQERLPSKQILVALHAMEDRPWSEYGKKQEPITPHQLAALLRPFDITPKKWREGGQTVRGYIRADFTDTWDRWLTTPSDTSAPHPQPATGATR